MSTSEQSLAPYALHRALEKPLAPEPLPWTEGGAVHDLWAVLARRWRVIAATIALAVGGTGLYCLIVTHWYLATATVLIEPRARELLNDKRPLEEAQDAFTSTKYDYYQTQFKLLRSQTLVRRVIETLGLQHDARFADPPLLVPADEAAPINPLLIRQYLRQLDVAPVRGTRLVTVSFEGRDAQLSATIASTHAQLFVRSGIELLYQATEQIRNFLETKLAELQPRMQEAQANLARFQSANRLLPIDLSKDVATERLMDLSRRHTQAEAERIALEAQYRLVEQGQYDSVPAVLTSALIQKLREDYNRLEVEQALLAQKFRPTYPGLQRLNGQLERARTLLDQETKKVAHGVEVSYLAAQRTVEQLEAGLDAQRSSLVDRKDVEGEFLTLIREAETTRSLYDNLLKRVKDLDVAAGSSNSNVSVTEAAEVPDHASIPPTKLALLISLVAGLLLGTGLAFLRDAADRTIQDAQDIRRTTGLGTFAVVPDLRAPLSRSPREWLRWHAARARHVAGSWRHTARSALRNGHARRLPTTVAIAGPPRLLLGNGHVHESAEAFRTLRTSLLLHQTHVSPRVIVICSAVGTEGKTTTAVNTAAALASCGASVLLIDGDLRMPRCHEALGLPVEPGLTDYLSWQLTPEPIQATHVENLSFLAAGRLVANPTELLSSWRMSKLLERVRKGFSFVVIDSPPVLFVSDGLLLANLADGVLLVAERGRSRHDHVRSALQRLHQAGAVLIGAVLNRGEITRDYYRYNAPAPNGTDGSAGTNGNGTDGTNGTDGSEWHPGVAADGSPLAGRLEEPS